VHPLGHPDMSLEPHLAPYKEQTKRKSDELDGGSVEGRRRKLTLSSPQLVRPRKTSLDALLQLRVVLLDGCCPSFGVDL